MFCEMCKGLMLPKEEKIVCTRCGHVTGVKKKNPFKHVEKNEKKEKVVILDGDVSTLPTTRAECSECGNTEANWWLRQTRRSDEPETRFLRCTKCKHTWREYD